jgi:hypothetical protein
MSVWGAQNFVTEVPVLVEEVAPGVGRIVCLECDGDPEAYVSRFPPDLLVECPSPAQDQAASHAKAGAMSW